MSEPCDWSAVSVPCADAVRLASSDYKMPSESKPLLTAQTEKPNHYTYLKEFRVEQCPLFLQHKCTQHRPFTCFHWHFMNQRRRRPVRRRDGTFNYSADNYCTKYDETTGICPDGDDCPYLHRTAGDTERRYHLRYYKTCMCVHDTDSRGYCVKNGLHCAFAHGSHDHRPPVYDIKEIQALEAAEADGSLNGPNALDKERNLMNEDPKWQDTNFVLSNYKTEPCKRPPRLCRQGYACPQYHNSKDKRRSPRKFKYRSTPCPNVKHGEEWGEPGNCDSGDMCSYCHTRTEQQFHPEIYKSTKCNDVQQSGYCPRGVFCAFAHVEQELGVQRDTGDASGTNLAEILSNALPPNSEIKIKEKSSESSNGSSEVSESASSTSSVGSNSCGSNKAPGAQLTHKSLPFQHHPSLGLELSNKLLATDKDPNLDPIEREQRKQALCFSYSNLGNSLGSSLFSAGMDTMESVVGNALDELNLDELNLSGALDRELDTSSPNGTNSISVGLASSAGLLGSSAPVNIPSTGRTGLSGFSPSNSPMQPFLNRLSQSDHLDFFNHSQMQSLSSSASKINNFSGFFDFQTQSISPSSRNHVNSYSMSPSINNNLEVVRLRDELSQARMQITNWEERLQQARTACEAWQRETEDANRKSKQMESKLQETINQFTNLKKEYDSLQGGPHIRSITKVSELSKLSLGVLKNLHAQLRQDLEEIEKVLYRETASKCMVCEERNRTITLSCNHFVLCDTCAGTQTECPYCQTPSNLANNI